MANFFKDNQDLKFYMERGIDWAPLTELVEQDYKSEESFNNSEEAVAFYGEILEMVGEFVANEVAPASAEIDRQEMHLKDGDVVFGPALEKLFKKIKKLDLNGMCVPRELGGLNCPSMVYMLCGELFARGDASVMSHNNFHSGIAMSMVYYSIMENTTEYDRESGRLVKTRFAKEIADILAGRAWGSMDLTEADAGSDLAAVRTKAELDDEGVWHITGSKVFISSGHAKYHFVLARTEDEAQPGLSGLSLFLVQAYTQKRGKAKVWHAELGGIEHKLGHHGSATVTVNYDQTPGELVGARGDGFKMMLLLMNAARTSVAFEALGLSESALRAARAFAAERPSMGKTIDRHEMVADTLDEMESDLEGLRAIAMHGAYTEEMAQRHYIAATYLSEPDSVEQARHAKLSRRFRAAARRTTPIAKYLGAEKAVEISRKALQVHGGVGYSNEYGAEKLLRDALVLPIYEGTSQIQALMAMKDTLGAIMKNPQAFVSKVAQTKWRALSARDPLERRVAKFQALSNSVQQHLMTRTATDKLKAATSAPIKTWPKSFKQGWDPKHDFSYAMLHAERLIQMLSDELAIELLWAQAKVHPERRVVLERYLERAEPRGRYLSDQIHHQGAGLLARLRRKNEADAEAKAAAGE